MEIGDVIEGKYKVLRKIGAGGMGTVYEGVNIRIERRVAIKVLHADIAELPEFAKRFEREARAAARIGSPHVCDVLDLGDLPNGERFIVMEFLEGMSLEERIVTRGKMTEQELAPIAFEILEGLGTMHHASVVHRDLKPANVFLAREPGRRQEVVKILDFGVAKLLPRADDPGAMTSTGSMMGTPLYMSPEQARGARDVDGRTDLYAASVMFYRALSGALPYMADNLHELLFKIVLEEPKPLAEIIPDVDPEFAALVMKGLERDPGRRWSSAREYQEAIAAWGRTQGIPSLNFEVTLPTTPPPLLPLSGSLPIVPAAVTPVKPITPVAPEKTPVEATQLAAGQTQAMPHAMEGSDRAIKINGKTPTAWSEDAPEIAKRAYAELAAKNGMRPPLTSDPAPSEVVPSNVPTHVPSKPKRTGVIIAGVGIAVLGLVGVIGVTAMTKPSPGPAPTLASSSPPPPASETTEPPPTPTPTPTATETAPAETATVATPEPTTTSVPTQHPTTKPVFTGIRPPATATATASAAPTTTASVAPTTTASSRGRKFRTDL